MKYESLLKPKNQSGNEVEMNRDPSIFNYEVYLGNFFNTNEACKTKNKQLQ